MTRRRHDRAGWTRRAEALLERGLEVLERRLDDPETSVPELVKALESIADAVTSHRALVTETDDAPPQRRRKAGAA